jgi:hypothetical protein
VALVLLGVAGAAGAQMVPPDPPGPGPERAGPDPAQVAGEDAGRSSDHGIVPSPFNRAIRSAVVPGWGQLTNGKPKKSVVQFGVQTYLLTRIVIESREAGEANRAADALRGMENAAGEVDRLESKAQDHYKRRRDLLFWWIIAGFYGAMDAYVDAHLGDFEKDLEDGRTLFSDVDPISRNVELGLRF